MVNVLTVIAELQPLIETGSFTLAVFIYLELLKLKFQIYSKMKDFENRLEKVEKGHGYEHHQKTV